MTSWGPSGAHYLRLVVASQPIERPTDVRLRFHEAFS
jgi:hypothetical protein